MTKRKKIFSLVSLVVLTIGLVAGIRLVPQVQEIREKAAPAPLPVKFDTRTFVNLGGKGVESISIESSAFNYALGPDGGDGGAGESTESAVIGGETLAETTGPVQFYYDGEGSRLAKVVDDDNYTIYPNAYIQKVVENGVEVWKKFYISGGKIVAIRVYDASP